MRSDKEAKGASPADEYEVKSTKESKSGNLEVGEIDILEELVGAAAEDFEALKTEAVMNFEVEVPSGENAFTEPIIIAKLMRP